MSDVIVVGSYVQDMAFSTPVFPQAGETRIGEFRTNPGGKGFNQAIACNRLEASTVFIGAVGDDAFGQEAVNFAQAENLSLDLQTISDTATAAAGIIIDQSARNMIVVALGANESLSVAHIEQNAALIQESQVLICQAESNLEATGHALELASSSGGITVFNTAPINEAISKDLFEHVDVITPNETEFVFLMKQLFDTDVPTDFWTHRDEKIHEYCQLADVATVILTLGENGCFVSHNPRYRSPFETKGSGFYRVPAKTVNAIDTTGAGDAFNGALAAGLVKYPGELRQAVEFANAAAALSTTRLGTAPAMPKLRDVFEFTKR